MSDRATVFPPIRLGLVIGQLSAGGAEGQLLLLCQGLDRARFSPVVYCLGDRTIPYAPLLEAAGVPVRVIAGARPARLWRLAQWLNRDRIEVVHAWLFIANAYAWLANRHRRRPLLTSARNCKRQGWLLDRLNRRAFAASDVIVANSQQVARYIAEQYGAPPGRTTVVYNAIDTQRFHPPAQRDGGGLCVVMIGRLVPQKDPLLFVAAAAALRQQLAGVRFVLIGDGPLRGEVEAAVTAAGLQACCTLAGERHDVPELLRAADLFWLPSRWEGLPNVVLEAMASGLPVIATDVGGTPELFNSGQEGFLIKAGDGEALVAHSLDLLGDANKRRHCAAAARRRAEQFAPPQMVAAMQQLYARVAPRACV
ncbi:MAG: glycosyltransferase [Deltaproteobacteria bacterium]|nr:glycosyltransferase [Deltaproteobacteria bacterium]